MKVVGVAACVFTAGLNLALVYMRPDFRREYMAGSCLLRYVDANAARTARLVFAAFSAATLPLFAGFYFLPRVPLLSILVLRFFFLPVPALVSSG